MSRFTTYLYQTVIIALLVFAGSVYANDSRDVYEKKTGKSLQNILDDVEFAITERNLKIVNRLHIGQGIKARGYENFPDYEIILYCNLDFARKLLALSPELINACPGRISIRQVDNMYIISAVLWPTENTGPEVQQLMCDMNTLVREVVDYAALKWLESYE